MRMSETDNVTVGKSCCAIDRTCMQFPVHKPTMPDSQERVRKDKWSKTATVKLKLAKNT